MPPAAFGGESEDALDRRFPGDREVDVLGGVLGAVQLVEECRARRARALRSLGDLIADHM